MLELLRIHNLALIEDLEMDFSNGMNVLTGETGAGKSFILKAINFVTGEKLQSDLVRPGTEKATVEALFVINNEEIILRRELLAESGRSRLYINNQLSSLEAAKELRSSLILHTSQQGQQSLMLASYQSLMLDNYLNEPELLEKKDFFLKQLNEIAQKTAELEQKVLVLQEKREVLEFQQQEINKISPKTGEEEELELKRNSFRNQADLADRAQEILSLLRGGENAPGIIDSLGHLERAVGKLLSYSDEDSDIPDALVDMNSRLQDLAHYARKTLTESKQDIDIEAIEARLYALAQLKRKLKRPLAAILDLQEEIDGNLTFLDSCDFERKQLVMEENALCDQLVGILNIINEKREKAAKAFSNALENELKKLGFSEHVKVLFEFAPVALHPVRQDCIELKAHLLWMPNPGQAPQPLEHIASGGELSRFLLAVVTVMSKKNGETPILIFDEVDAGVGGLTLNSVAASLSDLAENRQMLVITHWPQIAAKAKRHFKIEKEILDGQTYTRCKQLSGNSIKDELIRMTGGMSNESWS